MKRIFRQRFEILLSLLCICLLGSCSDKEETGGIQLTGGTKVSQTIFADDTSDEGDGIKFTTDGPWTAEVTGNPATRGSDVSWITLSRYSGDAAGDYTITVSISPNHTGADRTAYIRIYCGASTLTISVLQKATTETGDMPEEVAQTYDGKPAYVKFNTEKIAVPALPDESFIIEVQTNMIEPVIRVDLPGVEEYEEYVAAVIDFTPPDTENEGACTVVLEVFANRSDRERQGVLKFLNTNEVLIGSVLLVQESGALCRLIDKQATVSSLAFNFKTNGEIGYVRYALSEKSLSESGITDLLLNSQDAKEVELAEGQTEFDLFFDNLLPAKTYYLYYRPLGKQGEDTRWNFVEESMTAIQESKHDLVLEVSANPANGFTVYLPFSDDNLKGVVDWGDGKSEEVEGWSQQGVSHKYEVTSATSFEVRFTGILTNLELVADINAARQNTLLAVKQWGYTGLTNIKLSGFSSLKSVATDTEGAFRAVKHFGREPYGGSFTDTGIEAVPQGFFDYAVNATSFDDTFEGCTKLATIPAGLFKNCEKATSFKGTFINCESLQEIPEDIFSGCPGVTSFWFTFNGCKSLKAIPERLFANNTKVVSFEATFARCTSLQTIPAGLFANCPDVRYFGTCASRVGSYAGGAGIFSECTALQSIPEALFAGNPEVKDMSHAFELCTTLTTLPEKLFSKNTKLAFVEQTFQNCEGLKSVPAGIFDNNRQLLGLRLLFDNCTNLEGESPYTLVGDKKVHLYERADYVTEFVEPQSNPFCFRYCEKLSDYNDMPKGWK